MDSSWSATAWHLQISMGCRVQRLTTQLTRDWNAELPDVCPEKWQKLRHASAWWSWKQWAPQQEASVLYLANIVLDAHQFGLVGYYSSSAVNDELDKAQPELWPTNKDRIVIGQAKHDRLNAAVNDILRRITCTWICRSGSHGLPLISLRPEVHPGCERRIIDSLLRIVMQ